MRKVIFSKSSFERLPEFQTRTIIYEENGVRYVEKQPISRDSLRHIQSFINKYQSLSSVYAHGLRVVPCEEGEKDGILFPFVKGEFLSHRIRSFVAKHQYEEAFEEVKKFFACIRQNSLECEIPKDGLFLKVFGEVQLPAKTLCLMPADIDLIFDNVLIGENGTYDIIDYEWAFRFPVPTEYVLYRSILHSEGIAQTPKYVQERFWDLLDVDQTMKDTFLQMEINFQKSVYGSCRTLGELYQTYGMPVKDVTSFVDVAVCDELQSAYREEAKQREASQNREYEYFEAYKVEAESRTKAEGKIKEYQEAYKAEAEARAEAESKIKEYQEAYKAEAEARAEAEGKIKEYHEAYKVEAEARAEAEEKIFEYQKAYKAETEARTAAEKQATEYRNAYQTETEARLMAENRITEYQNAYNAETEARLAAENTALEYQNRLANEESKSKEYYEAYKTESETREAFQRKSEEYLEAYKTESEVREAFQRKADENYQAYLEESRLRMELQNAKRFPFHRKSPKQ